MSGSETDKVNAIWCRCATGDCIHKSDCAVHNEPAEEAGSCDCLTPAEQRALPGAHYSDGRRYSRISKAWIFAEDWNDREEVAYLQERLSAAQGEITRLREELTKVREARHELEAVERLYSYLHRELWPTAPPGALSLLNSAYAAIKRVCVALSPPSQQEIQR